MVKSRLSFQDTEQLYVVTYTRGTREGRRAYDRNPTKDCGWKRGTDPESVYKDRFRKT